MTQDPQWYAPPKAYGEMPPEGMYPQTMGMVAAGFWPRAIARFIDGIVASGVGFVAGAIAGIIGAGMGLRIGAEPAAVGAAVISGLSGIVASIAYHAVSEAMGGRSVGKLALGLVVISEDGTPISGGKAIIRTLAYFIDALFCGLVGYSVMNGSPMKQRLGDKWAHTYVIEKASAPHLALPSPGAGIALAIGMQAAILIAGTLAGAF
jgi:uncharacterized RDD family membrane protein YckC